MHTKSRPSAQEGPVTYSFFLLQRMSGSAKRIRLNRKPLRGLL